MANALTLSQVMELLKDTSAMEHSDEIMSYAGRVDEVATDIFNRQDNEFSKGLISLAQSLAISVMYSRGDLSPLDMIRLVSDDKIYEYSLLIVKMVVGISAMEELR